MVDTADSGDRDGSDLQILMRITERSFECEIAGEIDASTPTSVADALLAVAADERDMVLDLSAVSFFGVPGFRVLEQMCELRAGRSPLHVVGAADVTQRVIAHLGIPVLVHAAPVRASTAGDVVGAAG